MPSCPLKTLGRSLESRHTERSVARYVTGTRARHRAPRQGGRRPARADDHIEDTVPTVGRGVFAVHGAIAGAAPEAIAGMPAWRRLDHLPVRVSLQQRVDNLPREPMTADTAPSRAGPPLGGLGGDCRGAGKSIVRAKWTTFRRHWEGQHAAPWARGRRRWRWRIRRAERRKR